MRQSVDTRASLHFVLILPSMDNEFFQNIWDSMSRTASEDGVGVELQIPRTRDSESRGMAELLEIARISKVDGIAIFVSHEKNLTPEINRCELAGIPIITLESDAPKSRRSAFIGSNSFKIGQYLGLLMQEARPEGVRSAYIKSEYFSERASQWDIIQYGILTGLSGEIQNRRLIQRKTRFGVISSESTVREICYTNPDVNCILCTSLVDTVSAANVIQDFRLSAKVSIVGYGYNNEIQRGFDTGLIHGTVVRDPIAIGKEGVSALIKLNNNEFVPSFIYTPTIVLRGRGS